MVKAYQGAKKGLKRAFWLLHNKRQEIGLDPENLLVKYTDKGVSMMAVYDRVNKSRRRAIDTQKRYNRNLDICWRKGLLPKSRLIMMKIESLIFYIKLWWKLKQ